MSRYIYDTRSMFLHIPRTGGSWFKEAMHNMGFRHGKDMEQFTFNRKLPWLMGCNKHRPLQLSMRCFTSKVDFVFTIVRHPLDLYRSWWRTMHFSSRKNGKPHTTTRRNWQALGDAVRHWHPDFNEWVRRMVEYQPGFVTRLYELFIGPQKGEFCAYVARTETLVEDFFEVMTILKYGDRLRANEAKIRSIGTVQHPAAKPTGVAEWTDETRSLVERSERLAIQRFYGPNTKDRRRYAELSEHVLPRIRRRASKFFWSAGKAPFDLNENPSWKPTVGVV